MNFLKVFLNDTIIGNAYNFAWSFAAPYTAEATRSAVNTGVGIAANKAGISNSLCRGVYNYVTGVGADIAAQEAFTYTNGTEPMLAQYSWSGKIAGGVFVRTFRACSDTKQQCQEERSLLGKAIDMVDSNRSFVMRGHLAHRGYHMTAAAGTLAEAYLVNRATYGYLGYASYAAYAAACYIPGVSVYKLSMGLMSMLAGQSKSKEVVEQSEASETVEIPKGPAMTNLRDLQEKKARNINELVALACLEEAAVDTCAPAAAVSDAIESRIKRGRGINFQLKSAERNLKEAAKEVKIRQAVQTEVLPGFCMPF